MTKNFIYWIIDCEVAPSVSQITVPIAFGTHTFLYNFDWVFLPGRAWNFVLQSGEG